ncbi:hypothetical protein ACFVW2_39990, partial [Streptomyces sp. NPDC058171]
MRCWSAVPSRLKHDSFVHDFAEIMIDRRGSDLGAWMMAVDTKGDRALRSSVTGLRRELDAVTAGLTWSYSSGL